jgi:hypothetical protein
MALDLPRSKCPQRDSDARVEVIERTEASETLTQAQIKVIADKAVIVSRADCRCRQPPRAGAAAER